MKTNKFNIGDVVKVELFQDNQIFSISENIADEIDGQEYRIVGISHRFVRSESIIFYEMATTHQLVEECCLTLIKTNEEMQKYLKKIGYKG